MGLSRAFKFLILSFSTFMFTYQASVAVYKLMDPPIVDSTERLSITDMDSILITLCPLDQWNKTRLYNLDYDGEEDLMVGQDPYDSFIGWGSKQNLSFEELVQSVQNFNPSVLKFYTKDFREFIAEKRFYPKFGWCYDIINFTSYKQEIILVEEQSVNKLQVYITDKRMRTRTTVKADSHRGPKIVIDEGWKYEYIVDAEQLSNYNPRAPDYCKEYKDGEYEECVDEELQKIWKPLIKCNPPWISNKDQCERSLNVTKETGYSLLNQESVKKTVREILDMRSYPAEESCKKPCAVVQSTIILIDKEELPYGVDSGVFMLTLKFSELVLYTTEKLAYDSSQFLTDLGSNLGLWFGLSVFGITDLGIRALQWAKKIRRRINRKYFM